MDTSKAITPLIVKDAIFKCFLEAHKEVLDMMKEYHQFESEEEFVKLKELDIEMLLKEKMRKSGGNYENPSKEDITNLCSELANFAKKFRNPKIIEKHYKEIMKLVEKLPGENKKIKKDGDLSVL